MKRLAVDEKEVVNAILTLGHTILKYNDGLGDLNNGESPSPSSSSSSSTSSITTTTTAATTIIPITDNYSCSDICSHSVPYYGDAISRAASLRTSNAHSSTIISSSVMHSSPFIGTRPVDHSSDNFDTILPPICSARSVGHHISTSPCLRLPSRENEGRGQGGTKRLGTLAENPNFAVHYEPQTEADKSIQYPDTKPEKQFHTKTQKSNGKVSPPKFGAEKQRNVDDGFADINLGIQLQNVLGENQQTNQDEDIELTLYIETDQKHDEKSLNNKPVWKEKLKKCKNYLRNIFANEITNGKSLGEEQTRVVKQITNDGENTQGFEFDVTQLLVETKIEEQNHGIPNGVEELAIDVLTLEHSVDEMQQYLNDEDRQLESIIKIKPQIEELRKELEELYLNQDEDIEGKINKNIEETYFHSKRSNFLENILILLDQESSPFYEKIKQICSIYLSQSFDAKLNIDGNGMTKQQKFNTFDEKNEKIRKYSGESETANVEFKCDMKDCSKQKNGPDVENVDFNDNQKVCNEILEESDVDIEDFDYDMEDSSKVQQEEADVEIVEFDDNQKVCNAVQEESDVDIEDFNYTIQDSSEIHEEESDVESEYFDDDLNDYIEILDSDVEIEDFDDGIQDYNEIIVDIDDNIQEDCSEEEESDVEIVDIDDDIQDCSEEQEFDMGIVDIDNDIQDCDMELNETEIEISDIEKKLQDCDDQNETEFEILNEFIDYLLNCDEQNETEIEIEQNTQNCSEEQEKSDVEIEDFEDSNVGDLEKDTPFKEEINEVVEIIDEHEVDEFISIEATEKELNSLKKFNGDIQNQFKGDKNLGTISIQEFDEILKAKIGVTGQTRAELHRKFMEFQNEYFTNIKQKYDEKRILKSNPVLSENFNEQKRNFFDLKNEFQDVKREYNGFVQQKMFKELQTKIDEALLTEIDEFPEKYDVLNTIIDKDIHNEYLELQRNVYELEPEFKHNILFEDEEHNPNGLLEQKPVNLFEKLNLIHKQKLHEYSCSKDWPKHHLQPSSLLDYLFEDPLEAKPNVFLITLRSIDIGYSISIIVNKNEPPIEMSFNYAEDSILHYVEEEQLPPHLLEFFDRAKPSIFYRGCVIAEIHDQINGVPEKVYRILLRPTSMSVMHDMNEIIADNSHVHWTYKKKLKLERMLLLASRPVMCIDSSPIAGTVINLQHQMINCRSIKLNPLKNKFEPKYLNHKKEYENIESPIIPVQLSDALQNIEKTKRKISLRVGKKIKENNHFHNTRESSRNENENTETLNMGKMDNALLTTQEKLTNAETNDYIEPLTTSSNDSFIDVLQNELGSIQTITLSPIPSVPSNAAEVEFTDSSIRPNGELNIDNIGEDRNLEIATNKLSILKSPKMKKSVRSKPYDTAKLGHLKYSETIIDPLTNLSEDINPQHDTTANEVLSTQSSTLQNVENTSLVKHIHTNGICINSGPRVVAKKANIAQVENSLQNITLKEQTTTDHKSDKKHETQQFYENFSSTINSLGSSQDDVEQRFISPNDPFSESLNDTLKSINIDPFMSPTNYIEDKLFQELDFIQQ